MSKQDVKSYVDNKKRLANRSQSVVKLHLQGFSPKEISEKTGEPYSFVKLNMLRYSIMLENAKHEQVDKDTSTDELLAQIAHEINLIPECPEAEHEFNWFTEDAKVVLVKTLKDIEVLRQKALNWEAKDDYNNPFYELNLPVRTFSTLRREKLTNVDLLVEFVRNDPNRLRSIKGFGEKSYKSLVDALTNKGYL